MCSRSRISAFYSILLIAITLIGNVCGKPNNLKICVVGNPKVKVTHETKYCDLLEKSKNSPVTCVYEEDRVGCMNAVSKRRADFSVFEPEDLYFATLLDESWILVASEIKSLKKSPYQDGAVVVVRRNSNIKDVKDLQGKRLCHPGLESGPDWSPLFAQYFEARVAPSNCEKGLTVYEDRIKTTSGFFGAACKAGPWVVDPEEDARLKKEYSNLCSLCDSGDCRVEEKYRGSGGSVTCFKDGVGDVLWARHDEVQIHLKSAENAETDYGLLCENGTLMSISSKEPCVWLAKPWRVVGANRKSAMDVQKILEGLGNEEGSAWEQNLLHLIELYLQYIQNLAELRTPEDYLRSIPGYLSASSMSEGNCSPKNSVKWCVSSTEESVKCSWISKAASALAIEPPLKCVQKINLAACLKSVAETETDVVVVPPNFLYDARLKFDLKTFLVETGSQFNDSYLVSAVAKKNSNARTLEDLKGKRVCFSRRNEIGWNAAVAVLEEKKLTSRSGCGGHEGLSEFFGGICVMGKNVTEDGDLESCCHASDGGLGADDAGLLRCLRMDGCDVAFVDSNSLLNDKKSGVVEADLKRICRSDRSADCQWAWSDPNYLMHSSKMGKSKSEEAYSVFFKIGQIFGRKSRKNNPMLKIFGPFNGGVKNVLFRDSSTSFVSSDRWTNSNNYEEILEKLNLCSGSAGRNSLPFYKSFFLLLLPLIVGF